MNDSMILMARMRQTEMLQDAGKDKLAARVRRGVRRTLQTAGKPALRPVVSGTRPAAGR